MYTTSDMFLYIISYIPACLCILRHLYELCRSNNILKCKVYRQRILKSIISVPKSNLCYPRIILYTYCAHIDKNIKSRRLINASYFHTIKIYVRINVNAIPTLSFDILHRSQPLYWNLIIIAYLHLYTCTRHSLLTSTTASWAKQYQSVNSKLKTIWRERNLQGT